ncbi:MAG: N-acetylmuramoyl-L-alanine amidase [Anaerolineae bacterium]|nr:N-acetylmuramoyl-L-alanine amidase [Anaerolineae bacterium]
MTDKANSFFDDEPFDEFETRTFDTRELHSPPANVDGTTDPPGEVEFAAYDDDPSYVGDDSIGDDFIARTVEPSVSQRPIRRPLTAPSPRRAARATARPRHYASPRSPSLLLNTLSPLVIVSAAAVLIATIFSLWMRPSFFTDEFRAGLNRVQATQQLVNIQPSPLPTDVREVRIGIVAGHSGPPQDTNFEIDPGAVCPDGLTELEINEAVAGRVVMALKRDNYTVDLLNEFDPRLENYQANVLLSIHTNDCQDYGPAGSGYNAASAAARLTAPGDDQRLLNCLVEQYGATTGLPYHGAQTYDMTDYHTFGEISPDTPTAIIEIGFMLYDRAILTQNPELVAQGIANGIRCFLRPDLYNTTSSETADAPSP